MTLSVKRRLKKNPIDIQVIRKEKFSSKNEFQLSESFQTEPDRMMTDQNTAVLEVSVEENGAAPMPPTLLNDTPTVNVIRRISL